VKRERIRYRDRCSNSKPQCHPMYKRRRAHRAPIGTSAQFRCVTSQIFLARVYPNDLQSADLAFRSRSGATGIAWIRIAGQLDDTKTVRDKTPRHASQAVASRIDKGRGYLGRLATRDHRCQRRRSSGCRSFEHYVCACHCRYLGQGCMTLLERTSRSKRSSARAGATQ